MIFNFPSRKRAIPLFRPTKRSIGESFVIANRLLDYTISRAHCALCARLWIPFAVSHVACLCAFKEKTIASKTSCKLKHFIYYIRLADSTYIQLNIFYIVLLIHEISRIIKCLQKYIKKLLNIFMYRATCHLVNLSLSILSYKFLPLKTTGTPVPQKVPGKQKDMRKFII